MYIYVCTCEVVELKKFREDNMRREKEQFFRAGVR